jgi:hypothetical protein
MLHKIRAIILKKFYLLGCNAVDSVKSKPTFQRNMKNKRSSRCHLLRADFLLEFFFDPEDRGDIFPRNVTWLSTDYTTLCPFREVKSFIIISKRKTAPQQSLRRIDSAIFGSFLSVFVRTFSFLFGRDFNFIVTETHSLTELSPSLEAAHCAAAQELSILWNPEVHYRVHKSPPLVPILSHIDPPHPYSLRFILILSTNLRFGLPSGLFPSGFLTNILYAFLFSIRAM